MIEYVKNIREKIGHSPLLLVSAGIIIYKNGKILLQRRSDNGKWAIHGGCLELGETTEEAARRELKEEIGITPISLEFYGVFSGEDMHYFYPNGDEVYLVATVYFCDSYTGEICIDNDEVIEVEWFDITSLPEDINSPVDDNILRGLGDFFKERCKQNKIICGENQWHMK